MTEHPVNSSLNLSNRPFEIYALLLLRAGLFLLDELMDQSGYAPTTETSR